jgi:site-specific DNA-methyltransferase (adenine-specific)
MYSYRGDTVLDPFVGSGQTTKVAAALGRTAAGYDTRQEYVDYATARLEEPLRLRSKQLIARFEKTALSQQDQGTIKYRSSRSKSAKQKMGVRHLLDDAGA